MELIVAEDAPRAAAEVIARLLASAIRRRGAATIALSGGSTAPAMIDHLAPAELEWDRVGAWQVDERVAPAGSADRNVTQLVGLPCRVTAMPVDTGDLEAAGVAYAATLPDRFDVVHLGLGDDGHTASWPPGDRTIVRAAGGVAVVRAFRGFDRLTLTGEVVNAARHRIVLATGGGKQAMVARWLLDDRRLPISAVRRRATRVVLDPAAAPAATVVSPRPSR